jgi:nitrogen fixation/metabolism regulation signal transduction histidine kinase
MNNSSFQTKLRMIIVMVFILIILQSIYVIYTIQASRLTSLEKDQIITFQIIFLFLEMILGLTIFFYIPVLLKKSFKPIEHLFDALKHGKLEITLPENQTKGPISRLMYSANAMIDNLKLFDQAKTNKILEYRKRLELVMKNMDDAALIINDKFEIILINEHAKKLFKIISIDDYPSLLDFHFEGEILKFFKEALSQKILLPERKVYYPKIKKHITFRNGVIHGSSGEVKGMVFVIADLDLKKLNPDNKDKINQKSKVISPKKEKT